LQPLLDPITADEMPTAAARHPIHNQPSTVGAHRRHQRL